MPRQTSFARFLAVVAISITSTLGCKRANPGKKNPAVTNGKYDISQITCVSSEKSPAYPDATKKALLLEFDDLTSHTLELDGNVGTENIVSPDCSLILKRELFVNEDSRISFRDTRKVEFNPPECHQIVRFEETTFRFAASNGIFAERNRPNSEEIPFVVVPIDGGYQLRSAEQPEIQNIWQQYGCQATDQISLNWIRL